MIEHVDAALTTWFSSALDVAAVGLGPPESTSVSKKRATLHLQLMGIDEKVDWRTTEVADVRDDDGRVTARQAAARLFDLHYVCSLSGDPLESHRVLSQLIAVVISGDVVPVEFVPEELCEGGIPLEVVLDSSVEATEMLRRADTGATAAVVLRLVTPIWPNPVGDIAPPAESLHLDVGPPPETAGPERSSVAPMGADAVISDPSRKWKTVRRREAIARPGGDIAPATKKRV